MTRGILNLMNTIVRSSMILFTLDLSPHDFVFEFFFLKKPHINWILSINYKFSHS